MNIQPIRIAICIVVAGAICLAQSPRDENPTSADRLEKHANEAEFREREAKRFSYNRDTLSSQDPRLQTSNSDDPEARRLKDQIGLQEARAMELANKIRWQKKEANDPNAENPELKKMRSELGEVLTKAFELKGQLEQKRIQALQSRLEQLQRRADQRKSLGAEIIARRVRELIDEDETRWNNDNALMDMDPNAGMSNRNGTRNMFAPWPPADNMAESGNAFGKSIEESAKIWAKSFADFNKVAPHIATSIKAGIEPPTSPVRPIPPLPSYKDLATGLLTGRADIARTKNELAQVEELWKQKAVAKAELDRAVRENELAMRKYHILQEDYRGLIRDLELQLKWANLEEKASRAVNEKLQKLQKGVVPEQAIMEAERRLEQATNALESMRERLDRYQHVEELLDEAWNTDVSSDEPIEIKRWGLKLQALPEDEHQRLAKSRYRGGLLVIEVGSEGQAARNDIHVGDILVQLAESDTKSPEKLASILARLSRQADKVRKDFEVKFVIVRGDDVKSGVIVVPKKPELGRE